MAALHMDWFADSLVIVAFAAIFVACLLRRLRPYTQDQEKALRFRSEAGRRIHRIIG